MDPIVATLCSSLRRVPPDSIPAILDCIFAATPATPASLFAQLLDEFPKITEGIVQDSKERQNERHNCILGYAAALSHILMKSGVRHMHIFVWKLLIPMLKAEHAHDTVLFHEVTSMFLDVVAKTNSWEVIEVTIVPLLLRSIGLSMRIFRSEELAIYKWTGNSTLVNFTDNGSFDDCDNEISEKYRCEDFYRSNSFDFPLTVCCNILALMLDVALQINHASDSGSNSENLAKHFAGNLLWDLSNLALQMLSHSSEHRSFAIKSLLPFIFKALTTYCTVNVRVPGMHHLLTRNDFFSKIWKICKILFSLGSLERRDAFDILSLYLSFSSSTNEQEDVSVNRRDEVDLRADQEFWDEIKKGLLDKESLVRKQSLHILKTTLNLRREGNCDFGTLDEVSFEKTSDSSIKGKRGKWAYEEAKSLGVGKIFSQTELSFTGCYRWEAFVLLYEMLEEYGTHLVEAAWNQQIVLFLRSSFPIENSLQSVNEELYHHQMATAEQIFGWLTILWERGLCHDNPQVRCLIMQSFFGIQWESYGGCAHLVPKDFILGPLMQGLNDPVHHNEFGVKEIYSSQTIEAAARFLHQYASGMERRQIITFLVKLSSVPKRYAFGRAGLMCLVNCIAFAASGVSKYNNHETEQVVDAPTDEVMVETLPNSSQIDRVHLLDALRFILESSRHHFNPKYRRQVGEKIIAATTSVMTATGVPLENLLHFISGLPHEYTDYGGSLRHVVQKWLRSSDMLLVKAINDFPMKFVSCPRPLVMPFAYDDEELCAWFSEGKRWARVFFLVVEVEEQLSPVLKFIQNHGADICKQNNLEWVVVKFLILVCCLVNEFQVVLERRSKYQLAGGIEKYHDQESIMFDTISVVLLSFLEELVSFTKLSTSIFHSDVLARDLNLPGPIRGKLGGPSQRRLSSSLCTSVLEAITSTKTLATVSRWRTQFRADVTNSAQTFLWNFCWKTFSTRTPISEVDGEICIAAYEACAYALKDLVPIFSPVLLNVLANNGLFRSEEDGEALLDAYVSTFIGNINNVINVGNLARTRRAILINQKWSCLECLLLLPNYAQRNGVHLKRCKYYLSDTTLGHIFIDLVGSLENAGEVSVLPMLRSIRLTMELFDSIKKDQIHSSCAGITIEMMWLLVHSSWILHVSCNKRRVAPIAALLSSVLHYSVFGDERMHEFDNAVGPLKWFVEKILEEGTKSPRTIRLAALHLCGLWLAHPSTLKYYIKELKLLTLYGSVAFDEDFEAELSENHDARAELLVLSKSLDAELTGVYINTELYARVSVAVLFSRLADMAESTIRHEDQPDVIASGKMFLQELLNSLVTDKDLSKELYKKHSAIHRRKVRAWQMACVLSRFVDLDIIEQVTSNLHTSIYRNNLPSVRHYMETFGIYIYLKFPSLISQQLVPLLRNYDLRPQSVSSFVFIAANVILHAKPKDQVQHLHELLPPVVPFLTSHHHTLRGITQILVHQVFQKLPNSNSCSCSSVPLESRCFDDLRSYLAHNPDCARLRVSMDRYLDSFDPVKAVSPDGIFTYRVEELEFECVPTTLMDRVNDFLNSVREDLRSSMAKDATNIRNESIHVNPDPKCSDMLNSNGEQQVIQLQNELLVNFQRKITFTQDVVHDSASTVFSDPKKFQASLFDISSEDQLVDQLLHSRGVIVEKLKSSRQKIILVASLIDRIPNLAGLARTCEVFRAGGLAIADKNVLNDKQFQLISVTADKWVPIVEVPVGSMKAFLEKKKQESYAILGLEQTANSIPMDQYNFPERTVLVLGREKEGIPVEIIHMLDACIEIPQLGVVRSLNVHVSGAIALWEYTRQQRLR